MSNYTIFLIIKEILLLYSMLTLADLLFYHKNNKTKLKSDLMF